MDKKKISKEEFQKKKEKEINWTEGNYLLGQQDLALKEGQKIKNRRKKTIFIFLFLIFIILLLLLIF